MGLGKSTRDALNLAAGCQDHRAAHSPDKPMTVAMLRDALASLDGGAAVMLEVGALAAWLHTVRPDLGARTVDLLGGSAS